MQCFHSEMRLMDLCSVLVTQLLLLVSCCFVANGQLLLNFFRIEVTAQAVLQDESVIAEMIIEVPNDVALNPLYEVIFRPDNRGSMVTIIFLRILRSFTRSRTPQGFLAYQLDGLEQDELYTIQIQDNRGSGDIIQVSDPFWLMTTSVQSITAEAGFEDAMVTCHFLMGARADGCLVQWSVVNSTLDSGGSLQISRDGNSSVATGMITDLLENSTYTVQAFGTRAGANLHASLPIVLPSNLVTTERPEVTPPDTNITTVNYSIVPTITTTRPTTENDTNIPDEEEEEPSENGASTLLIIAIPTSVGGIFALSGVAIAMTTCIVSLTIVRKRKKNAMDEEKGMHVCPEHSTIPTERSKGYELTNGHHAVDPFPYDYVKVKVQPTSPLYAVADPEGCSGTRQATEGEEEEYYVNEFSNVKKSNSSSSGHEIIVEENRAYDAKIHVHPHVVDSKGCSNACTATQGEEEEYYVNENTSFHPNVQKSNSLSSDYEISVEENRAYDANIRFQPQVDDEIYY